VQVQLQILQLQLFLPRNSWWREPADQALTFDRSGALCAL
jgi:hypothetical protein